MEGSRRAWAVLCQQFVGRSGDQWGVYPDALEIFPATHHAGDAHIGHFCVPPGYESM